MAFPFILAQPTGYQDDSTKSLRKTVQAKS